MCFLKLSDIHVITDLRKHFIFYIYIVICLKKSKKIIIFCTLYFIFKILTYKKNSKPIGENSSLVTFFLTTRYRSQCSSLDYLNTTLIRKKDKKKTQLCIN